MSPPKQRPRFLTLFLLLLLSVTTAADHDVVFYLEDEPIYTSKSIQSPGFLMEVVGEMNKLMKLKVSANFLPWNRAQYMAIKTPNAVIFPLSRTKDREANYTWICKVFDVPVMFITKEGRPPINDFHTAREMRGIGVIIGTPQEEMLKAEDVPYIALTGKQLYEALADDQVKAIYTAKPEAMLGWKQGEYSQKLQYGRPLQTLPLWIAASKKSPNVKVQDWNDALDQLKASGRFDNLRKKYFGDDPKLFSTAYDLDALSPSSN
ncbi:ABC-type amino acid transport/signal transduction systems, periplasmic component/domain [Hahella chejuensis KCTC 2396]|uniref:ABC-type amino acid transport/signal transduction systems, periplasmic component/domain n=1 Tax=Hahella chejuensis (strain KCTC 2396) TaxID=349521 RepID=Q2SB68_HAHCH|nr:transporter substrate-binding domain-containing protein [Hahella chejuensis]ABC32106.1 ABC-type amino acid transport/signal transduction systems, periplasmic component/domain [Hahella chejuensis KCTC 2396]